ncbi:MAG: hypothetical protein MAG458_00131 [Nitrosopumilus sp.]|nr:hypothetical protein [Nitrosopumilus sp.]
MHIQCEGEWHNQMHPSDTSMAVLAKNKPGSSILIIFGKVSFILINSKIL